MIAPLADMDRVFPDTQDAPPDDELIFNDDGSAEAARWRLVETITVREGLL